MSAQPAMSAPPPASSSPGAGASSPLQNGASAAVASAETPTTLPAATAATAIPSSSTPQASAPATHAINPNEYGIHYISPLAKHEDIVNGPELFWDTLRKCHAAYRTKFSIPKIGGKELDLHKLYVEVTARGGQEKVTKERKWKDITVAFSLPRTTTSASYVLRKYYESLLLRYEGIHFLGKTGPVVDIVTPRSAPLDLGLTYPVSEGLEAPVKKTRKRKSLASQEPLFDPAASIGSAVTGAIDGKFENGYLVTVHVGEEKLNGVLYHVPHSSKAAQFATLPHLMSSITAEGNGQAPEVRTRRKRRRKDEMPKKDPDAPRANRTGYNFFFAEKRAELKEQSKSKDREISRIIGQLWNSMTEADKRPWQERGIKDKERYEVEMRTYRERTTSQMENGGGAVSDAVAEAAGENDNGTDGDASQDYQAGTDGEVDPSSRVVEHMEVTCNASLSGEAQEVVAGSEAGSPQEQYDLQGHEQAVAIFDSKEMIVAGDSVI